MPANSVLAPFTVFTESNGTPLENGYLYIGASGQNPEVSAITVYYDADLTIPAAQPIRTIGGYPSRAGSPTSIYVGTDDYSLTVRDRNGVLVYSSLNVQQRFSGRIIAETANLIGHRRAVTVGGTANAITATFSPAFTTWAEAAGIVLAVPLSAPSTSTTPTFAPDGLAAKTIVRGSDRVLDIRDIPGGGFVGLFVYNESLDAVQMINPNRQGAYNIAEFGAVCDNVTDDTAAITAAIDAVASGSTLLIPGIAFITGLVVDKRIDIIGINTGGDASGTTGSGFRSASNAAILNYSNSASRFALLKNINLLGAVGAGANQHGIYINNGGLRIEDVTIRACGGSGINCVNSYAGSYRDIYISLCAADGVTIDIAAGANIWSGVTSAANGGHGFNLFTMDGSDTFIGCGTEQNTGRGIYFGNGVIGNTWIGTFSELNVAGTLLFAAGSNYNSVHFNSYSSSSAEPAPVNSGGSGNTVSGKKYGQGSLYRIADKLGIGATGINPSYAFDVNSSEASNYVGHLNNSSATTPNNLFLELNGVTAGAGATFLDCWDNARRLQILGNGNVQNVNNSYAAISDRKLKENITDATPKLADLLRVRVVNYGLKSQPGSKLLGVVGQELEQIFPGLIEETKDIEWRDIEAYDGTIERVAVETGETTKAVKYSLFVPMLIKAIQEQQAQIDDLKAQIGGHQ